MTSSYAIFDGDLPSDHTFEPELIQQRSGHHQSLPPMIEPQVLAENGSIYDIYRTGREENRPSPEP